ncbi:hypothetical protein QR680_010585 [Steinernema hermaphroditum]|uniref:Major facilitator superfamily (MFS) profile domain-containing protein n=1 Tax=Steinernema hermaphroditum TaxID=289476 RepID=A0AA39MBU3_9BILA|nr:hypothetical protein QR680_010585 [Steinernema hermaphroditum]
MRLLKKVTAFVKAAKKTSRKVKKQCSFKNMDEAIMAGIIMASSFLRYSILTIALLTMTMVIANTVLFNFTVICMKPEQRGDPVELNETRYYSSNEEGWIISMTSFGNIIGTLPAIYITDHFGLRLSYTMFGLISGISTMFYPMAAADIYFVMLVRLAQGFGMACAFLTLGIVPMEYGGEKGKRFFVTVLTCSYQLGPFSTMPISAAFCESTVGWSGVYYLFGIVTIVLFVLFGVVYGDWTEEKELTSSTTTVPLKIEDGSQSKDGDKPVQSKEIVPYRSIFTTPSTWGILTSGFGDSLGYFVFYLYGPIYLHKVLDFEVEQTGVFAAVPYVVSMGTKLLGVMFLYSKSFMTEKWRIMILTVSSQAAMSINFVILTLLSADMRMWAEVIYISQVALSGLHFVGMITAAQIVSHKYTHIISSAIAAQESAIGLLFPPIVSMMAPNHKASEWAMVFYYIVGVLVLTNISFVVLTKIKPAVWAGEDQGEESAEVGEKPVRKV